MSLTVQLDPRHPEGALLDKALAFLREGRAVAFPTETFYALGVAAYHEAAIEKVFVIKGRNYDKPLPLILQGESMLEEVAGEIPECARALIRRFWPGPLTLIFKASKKISPRITALTGTVAVRESSHPLAQLLVAGVQMPITATSANASGYPACSSAGEIRRQLGSRIDLIIDAGETAGGMPSTLVDLTSSPPLIVREGAIAAELLQPFWE